MPAKQVSKYTRAKEVMEHFSNKRPRPSAKPDPFKWPRTLDCARPECIKAWQEETKDERENDDTDFWTFHCRCHNLALGKTSLHCMECAQWVCQNCSFTDDDELFREGQGDVLCRMCFTAKLHNELAQLQHQKSVLELALLDAKRRTEGAEVENVEKSQ